MASLSEAYDNTIVTPFADEHPAARKSREAKQALQKERQDLRAARFKKVGDWFRKWCCTWCCGLPVPEDPPAVLRRPILRPEPIRPTTPERIAPLHHSPPIIPTEATTPTPTRKEE
jgi:hypothetical protein